jgi:adenylosuccinate lyase
MSKPTYQNPLVKRYASDEMLSLFSGDNKFQIWRRLWVALAESERELGLNITKAQIAELKKYAGKINHEVAEKRESQTRHDVMSHVYAYGVQATSAAGIIHLGATSAFVGDNADLIIQRDALLILRGKLLNLLRELADFASEHKALPMLGKTHFQPAQPVTLGKRAALWLQDFYFDYLKVSELIEGLPFHGVKGTTGTMASFLELFNGSKSKAFRLEKLVAKKMGFDKIVDLSGQTYSRKIDASIADALRQIAVSAIKMTSDIRLMQGLGEIEEPFGKHQIGSSAMAYKRNPMRSERVSSLAKFLMNISRTLGDVASAQWFERTLDDSAARRIAIPEQFLAADAILDILSNIASGIEVYPRVIEKNLQEELPFMATENILMKAVKNGGDRQTLHEKIRQYSMKARRQVKEFGKENNLLDLIAADKDFGLSENDLVKLLNPKLYIGLCPEQVDKFIKEKIAPLTAGAAKVKTNEPRV